MTELAALAESNRNLVLAARAILGSKPKTHLTAQEHLVSRLSQALLETTKHLEDLELVYGDNS